MNEQKCRLWAARMSDADLHAALEAADLNLAALNNLSSACDENDFECIDAAHQELQDATTRMKILSWESARRTAETVEKTVTGEGRGVKFATGEILMLPVNVELLTWLSDKNPKDDPPFKVTIYVLWNGVNRDFWGGGKTEFEAWQMAVKNSRTVYYD